MSRLMDVLNARPRDRVIKTGSSPGSPAPLYSFADRNRLMGFEEVWRFNRTHAEI